MTSHAAPAASAAAARTRSGGVIALAVVVALGLLAVTFWVGARWGGATRTATAYCSVVADFISCGDQPGSSEYIGGTFVQWVGDGATQEGRPDCLSGFDRVIRVDIYYEEVNINGRRVNQIVGVNCDSATKA